MKLIQLLFVYVGLLVLSSCQSRESLSIYTNEQSTSLTKSNAQEPICVKHYVSTPDAIRFSALYYPERNFTITPYLVKKDTLLHILNYEGGGWLVISGDRRYDPIIAESPDGYLNINSDESYVSWFKSIGEDISILRDSGFDIENDNTAFWQAIAPIKVDGVTTKAGTPKWVIRNVVSNITSTWSFPIPHLIETKWGREAPWNSKLPYDNNPNSDGSRCSTGCVPVAVAQLLYYLHYEIGKPTGLYHNISCLYPGVISPADATSIGFQRSNYVSNSTRWDDMALTGTSYGNTEYVGNLMLDIGNRFNTLYGCEALGGSGTNLQLYYDTVFSGYGIACTESSHSLAIVKNSLESDMPVIVRRIGTNTSNYNVNHTWIIDGLAKEIREYIMTRYCEFSYDWTEYDEVYDTFAEVQQVYGFVDDGDSQDYLGSSITNYYYQMNWGEDGVGDGAYYSSNGVWISGDNNFNSTTIGIYHGFQ